jgi:hypothetical protein
VARGQIFILYLDFSLTVARVRGAGNPPQYCIDVGKLLKR